MARTPKQLELFAGAGDGKSPHGGIDPCQIHALGLLGWKDPLWTTRITIQLLDGHNLCLRLLDIRRARMVDCDQLPTYPIQDLMPNQ
jgi:hypothetical protein